MTSLRNSANYPSLRYIFTQPDGNWIYSWNSYSITLAELDEWVFIMEARDLYLRDSKNIFTPYGLDTRSSQVARILAQRSIIDDEDIEIIKY